MSQHHILDVCEYHASDEKHEQPNCRIAERQKYCYSIFPDVFWKIAVYVASRQQEIAWSHIPIFPSETEHKNECGINAKQDQDNLGKGVHFNQSVFSVLTQPVHQQPFAKWRV